jgi:hypothetical protein
MLQEEHFCTRPFCCDSQFNPSTPKLNPSAQRCLKRFLLGILLLETCISLICVKNQQIHQLLIQVINYVWYLLHEISDHQATKHNTPIHNILSTIPQLIISQKALRTLPEDGNVIP